MKNYICKGCGEEINPYFNSTCSYCGTENPVMTKPKMPKIESAYGESPLAELYKYYQRNKRIFSSYLMNEGKDEEKKKPNFPKEIGGLHASKIWIDEASGFDDCMGKTLFVKCPKCGKKQLFCDNIFYYRCMNCYEMYTKEQYYKEAKLPVEELYVDYFVDCPECGNRIRVDEAIVRSTIWITKCRCGHEFRTETELFKRSKQKEKKMLKVISDVYEKTSDAVLVEKHFGICHGVFNDSNPMDAILINGFKEEILKKAKELEKAENDKKV